MSLVFNHSIAAHVRRRLQTKVCSGEASKLGFERQDCHIFSGSNAKQKLRTVTSKKSSEMGAPRRRMERVGMHPVHILFFCF